MNIRVNLKTNIADGTEVVFRSPADCSQVTGLVIYHTGGKTEFAFADAHGHNVGDIDHLFAENAVVKVILDVTAGMAFVQNADTNAYIERTFIKSVNGINPDSDGNVEIEVGGKGSGIYIGSGEMPEGYNVQIDPEGEVLDLASLQTDEDVKKTIEEALEDFEPPESGGGIEVSGAKVGDFLKVAEVDEKGVPTAWETAEMPKDKEWELLQTIVTEEDVNILTISNIGKKEVDLQVGWHVQNADSTLGNGSAKIDITLNGDRYLWASAPLAYIRKNVNHGWVMHFTKMPNNYTEFIGHNVAQGEYTACVNNLPGSTGDVINSIAFYAQSGQFIKAGASIKVYGR